MTDDKWTTFDRFQGGVLHIDLTKASCVYPTKFAGDPNAALFGREVLEVQVEQQCYVVADTERHRELLGLPPRKLAARRAAAKAKRP